MALSARDIERVCDEVLQLENAYLTELATLLLSELANGTWDATDKVVLYQLYDELSTKIQTVQSKHELPIEHKASSGFIAALTGAALVDMTNLGKVYKGKQNTVEVKATSTKLKTMAQQTADGMVSAIRKNNLAMTAAAQKAWYSAATGAMADIQHGGLSYDQAISKAVSALGNAFKITYSSGRQTTPDVALRRLMRTELSQAGGRMTLEAMESYGHELAITSTHYGARPSHAVWQGKPFGIHGKTTVDGVTYPDMVSLTDYGSATGLKGVNCRHMIFPYYPGITDLPDRDFAAERDKWGKSSDEHYYDTQRQRALERRVRATKASISNMEQAGLGLENASYVQKRLVLGRQQRELKAWSTQNQLPRAYDREKAYGVAKQPRALYTKPNKTY